MRAQQGTFGGHLSLEITSFDNQSHLLLYVQQQSMNDHQFVQLFLTTFWRALGSVHAI